VPAFASLPVRVRVPATSANLGPGFDSAGLALSLYDDVVVRATGSGLSVHVQGEGADYVPRDRRHLVVTSLRATFDRLGGQPAGLEVRCTNRIPHSRGLGSSSAAICAAVVAARALVDRGDELLDDDGVLRLADELEGHPDNVAACLRGGVTFAWGSPVEVLRLDAHADLAPVALIPSTKSSTRKVRGLLPPSVPFADAAANAARAALLPTALTRLPGLLFAATEDRLHQQYRSSAMPRSARLVAALREREIAAVISGAGPTVLALVTTRDVGAVTAAAPPGWTVLPLAVEREGARVVPLH
jgi:homoserine kinase